MQIRLWVAHQLSLVPHRPALQGSPTRFKIEHHERMVGMEARAAEPLNLCGRRAISGEWLLAENTARATHHFS
jgi:hypothetical protein